VMNSRRSFDHLAGAGEQRRRQLEVKRFCRSQVDGRLKMESFAGFSAPLPQRFYRRILCFSRWINWLDHAYPLFYPLFGRPLDGG
jgi:hypothetical protein